MPIPSPFFERTSALCESMNYKEWAGYYAIGSYLVHHDMEYFAFRLSAGLLDVSPLFKYTIMGPDAARFLSRVMVRNINKMAIGKVVYCCWCTDEGKVIDDGTVMRRDEENFFVTSADPCYSWFSRLSRAYDVEIQDVTAKIGGLALQGPTSRDILAHACQEDIANLGYFRTGKFSIGQSEVYISRTGFTGDLGYEIWMDTKSAIPVYDALLESGRNFNIRPAGLDALDVTRIEAGLILKDADYYNALHALTDDRMSSPYEITLGWTVDLEREGFIGQAALKKEFEKGSDWAIVGIEYDWPEIEHLFAKNDLPPELGHKAWRSSAPIYTDKSKFRQIGYATSGTWSPILKKYIALATIENAFDVKNTEVYVEFTVEHVRETVKAFIRSPQFYNPKRKRSSTQKAGAHE